MEDVDINIYTALELLYLSKLLHDYQRFDLIKYCMSDELDEDFFYESLFSLMECVFPDCHESTWEDLPPDERDDADGYAYEALGYTKHNYSSASFKEYFVMMRKYGRKHELKYSKNPYRKAIESKCDELFSYAYTLSWRLVDRSEPTSAESSRLVLYISTDADPGYTRIVYGLIELYEWVEENCEKLRRLMRDEHAKEMAAQQQYWKLAQRHQNCPARQYRRQNPKCSAKQSCQPYRRHSHPQRGRTAA